MALDLGMLGKMMGLPPGGLPPIPCALCDPDSGNPQIGVMSTVILGTPVCLFHADIIRRLAADFLNRAADRGL